jgi:phospholipid/cholesterol/gamma-HCH transport system substrate-binding protein
LGPGANEVAEGQNISQDLRNVNVATGNGPKTPEALKPNFFFKGFFNHGG